MRRLPRNPITVSVTFEPRTFKRYYRPWSFKKAKSAPVGLISFICCTFEANEIRAGCKLNQHATQKPLTDEQIANLIVSQFPDKANDLLVAHTGKNRPMTINAYRGKYNRGELRFDPPLMPSFRYNDAGKRVNGRSGNRLLTPLEITSTILEFNARKARKELCKTH